MENSLNFTNTMPVQAFMNAEGISKLQVVQNPNTGKLFLAADGEPIGKVGSKDLGSDPQISRCSDGQEQFIMIHKGNTDNVKHTFTA